MFFKLYKQLHVDLKIIIFDYNIFKLISIFHCNHVDNFIWYSQILKFIYFNVSE